MTSDLPFSKPWKWQVTSDLPFSKLWMCQMTSDFDFGRWWGACGDEVPSERVTGKEIAIYPKA